MTPLRIVMLMLDPPLPFGNAAARGYYSLLKALAARGHRVTAFATMAKPEDLEASRAVFPAPVYDYRPYLHPRRQGAWAKLESFRRPYSYMFSPEMKRDFMATLSGGFDALHLEMLWSGWLGLPYRERALLTVQFLFQIDLENQPPGSLFQRILDWRSKQAENYLIRTYPNLSTLTPRLTQYAQRISPRSTVHTVPLSLDFSLYPFEERRRSSEEPVLGLVGSFDWFPSYSAGVRLLTRLWPAIKARVPRAKLLIVGRRAKARLDLIAPSSPDVEILENVPDMLPYFRRMDTLLYAPGQGSGMKVKILEAFALGVPVVTTEEGVEGIPAGDGVHAGIAGDDMGLIARAVALLEDVPARNRQILAARQLVEKHCNVDAVVNAFEKIYAQVGAGHSLSFPETREPLRSSAIDR